MIYSQIRSHLTTKVNKLFTIITLCLLVLALVISPVAFAQNVDSTSAATTEIQQTDTAVTNKTMKSVFKELKHITKTGSTTLNSILMILGVISVVAIAMWLSFRNDPEEENA